MLVRVGAVLLLAAFSRSLGAQRDSSATVRSLPPAVAHTQSAAGPGSSLAHDVKRGAAIGGITGAVLGLVGLATYAWSNNSRCCEHPPIAFGSRRSSR